MLVHNIHNVTHSAKMSSLDAAASATDEQPKPEFVYKTNPITGKQYKYFPYQPNKMLNKGIKHVEVFFDMAPQRPQPIRIEQFIPTNYNIVVFQNTGSETFERLFSSGLQDGRRQDRRGRRRLAPGRRKNSIDLRRRRFS